jgi:hypothetical protein
MATASYFIEGGIFFCLASGMIGFLSGFWGDFCADEFARFYDLMYNERVAPGNMNRLAVADSAGPPP